MPHRVKNRHKPRHHAHKVKPSNISKPGLPPLVPPTPAPALPAVDTPTVVADTVEPDSVVAEPTTV
jgi:hypothetical protein